MGHWNTSYIPVKARAKTFIHLDTSVHISVQPRMTEILGLMGGQVGIERALLARERARILALPAGMKFCGGICGDVRPVSYFDRDAHTFDGYYRCCKQCRAEHRQQMKGLYPEREQAQRIRDRERKRTERGSTQRYENARSYHTAA